MNNKKPELLAPAGSYEAFLAAVHNGCDAVYLGGQSFGARSSAKNFDREQMVQVLDYAHTLGKKVYITLNTLIKEEEMPALMDEVDFLYREGADALILQDLGAFEAIHTRYPDLPLHASTQMTIHSRMGALACKEMGFERTVLSRELSLAEIEGIKESTGVELECFVHGALCYCYSGQCLMSSIIGGRSGNRGACAQPCRLPYTMETPGEVKGSAQADQYLLSPKDIQTLTILPQLIQSGIDSFKIEGRMKNAAYVGLMTSLYRHYIDLYFENPKAYQVDEADLLKMSQIFNRGGFSEGYYLTRNSRDMMSLENPKHQGVLIGSLEQGSRGHLDLVMDVPIAQGDCLEIIGGKSPISFTATQSGTSRMSLPPHIRNASAGDAVYRLTSVEMAKEIALKQENQPEKCKIRGRFMANVGEPAKLWVYHGDLQVEIIGEMVSQAKTSPMSDDQIRLQLLKTGNEPADFDDLEIETTGAVFMPLKQINAMRRDGIARMIETIIHSYKREIPAQKALTETEALIEPQTEPSSAAKSQRQLNVLIADCRYLRLLEKHDLDTIYIELMALSEDEILECLKSPLASKTYFALPRIIRDTQAEILEKRMALIKDRDYAGILIRSIDGLKWVPQGKPYRVDYTANVMNAASLKFWKDRGADQVAPSAELNLRELSTLKSSFEMPVYGYLPLMVSSQCVTKTKTGKCPKDFKDVLLTDRKNMTFRVVKDCHMCSNTIYNALPTMILDKIKALESAGAAAFRLELTVESMKQAEGLLALGDALKRGERITTEQAEAVLDGKNYTRGHYNRGII